MRLFADTNITAPAVSAVRAAGHDVVYSSEWPSDPGDIALLAEAHREQRIFLTKDHDIGALVFGQGAMHSGVILIDDVGDAAEEAELLPKSLNAHHLALEGGGFLRVDASGRIRTR